MSEVKRVPTLDEMRQRVGIFTVPIAMMQKTEKLMKLFDGLLVTRCEFLYSRQMFIYEAMSMDFEKILPNKEPTVYSIEEFKEGYKFIRSEFIKKMSGQANV